MCESALRVTTVHRPRFLGTFICRIFQQVSLLYSYASMHCITVLSWSFYRYVLPFVYFYSCNSRVHVTQVKGIVLRTLYTHACRDRRADWGAKVKHLRRLAIVGPVSWYWIIFTLLETLRRIMQSLSIKQSLGRDVPTSSGESGGSSGA
jgi:hypothetical protein